MTARLSIPGSALAIALSLSACSYNNMKAASGPVGDVDVEMMALPDFRAVNQFLIAPKCLNCHAKSTGDKGGLNLESYAAVRGQINRIAFRSLEKNDMPPDRPLMESERRLLGNWIEAGAPETVVAMGEKLDPGLETGPADWEKIDTRIFRKKCADCHSGTSPDAGLDLTKLADVRAKAVAIFERTIIKQDMPVAPYPALSPRERRVLLRWLDSGMLE